ncbi:SAM-dependent methlyltransferase, putative [Babesia ovata]|uniref:SAM-dependent methlyltransferase, putative n=1 Tax=Babesia ovata TaxID=189622 RepID=A0A2H6KAU7_9APIC|nr:SAM-dependent methlyltransferase, putative [Babesia ovata]GBE60106.1 SAM-dependent methlyltransferase, putative [Babesia ovata]
MDDREAADRTLRGYKEVALDFGLAACGEPLGGPRLDETLLLQEREDRAIGLVEHQQDLGVVSVRNRRVIDTLGIVLSNLRREHAVDEVLLQPLVGVVDQQLLVRVALEVLEPVDVQDAYPAVRAVVKLDDAVDLVNAELEQRAVQVLRKRTDVHLRSCHGYRRGDVAALDLDDLREQDARDAPHEVIEPGVGAQCLQFTTHSSKLLHVVDAGSVAALAAVQEAVRLHRAEAVRLLLGCGEALQALVEDVVVALVVGLELDAGQLQHVAANYTALKPALGRHQNLDELAEPGTVVVAQRLSIAKRLQDHVGAHHDLLHVVRILARPVREEAHQLLRSLGFPGTGLATHDARLALVVAQQPADCALRNRVRVRGHVGREADGGVRLPVPLDDMRAIQVGDQPKRVQHNQ